MEIKRSVLRLIVSDFRRSYRFYRDTLGLSLDFGTEDDAVAEFDAETVLLTIVDKEQVEQIPAGIYTTAGRGSGDRSVLVFIERHMDSAAIETRRWWGNGAHAHSSMSGCPRLALPITEELARSTLAVPIFRDLKAAAVDRVIDGVETMPVAG